MRVFTGVLLGSLMMTGLASGCGDAGWSELEEGETATSAEAITYSAKAMSAARYDATGTVLADGRVLVVGGRSSSATLSTAQLYNPATDSWSSAASLPVPRALHTTTLLGTGKVFVVGGNNGSATAQTTYLYNKDTNLWASGKNLAVARQEHTATLLANGKVLVVGGGSGSTNHKTAALYDPDANTWTDTGSMAEARRLHAATLLADGRVLVTGGRRVLAAGGFEVSFTAELYDPATGQWSLLSGSAGERHAHTATRLASGKVLIAGGLDFDGNALGSRVFDPSTLSFTSIAGSAAQRYAHSAVLLPDGRVLLAGGRNVSGSPLSSAHLFDEATNTWQTTDLLQNARSNHIALNLQGDRVLFVGGLGTGTTALSSVEISRLSIDKNLGSGANATETGNTCGGKNDFTPSCTSYSHEERAYLWQAPAAGDYVFSTVDAAFTLDTILSVLDARTDTPLAISGGGLACNDDAPGTKQSKVTVSLDNGQRVIVVVEGYGAPPQDTCGSFKLSITPACEAGDPCIVAGQQGVCAEGVTQCVNGAQICAQIQGKSLEKCDGLDNDCDGLVDESKACLQGACCSSGPEVGLPCTNSLDCGGYACNALCVPW